MDSSNSNHSLTQLNLTHWQRLAVIFLALLFALLAQLLCQRPLWANTITVDTTTDEIANNATCSLREAVNAANLNVAANGCPAGSGADLIVLPSGIYTLTLTGNGENANTTGDLNPTDPAGLTIRGALSTTTIINANGIDRVLHTITGTLLLDSLTLYNGNAGTGKGGGILAADATTLTAVRVVSNTARLGGGAYFTSTAIVSGTSLTDNLVTGLNSGGGAYFSAAAIVRCTTFNNNRATAGTNSIGGALFENSANVLCTIFSNNSGDGSGGAHFNNSANITDTQFIGNLAMGNNSGGGAEFSKAANMLRTTFISNTAIGGSSGGGAYFGSQSTINVSNTTFISNTSTSNNSGGGARFNSATLVTGINFSNNMATGSNSAGGLYFNSPTNSNMRDVTISNNTASGNSSSGGARFTNPATLANVSFISNTATASDSSGGALFDNTANVTGTIFSHNTGVIAGGVVFSSTATINNTNFANNSATGNNSGGGAYFMSSANLSGTLFSSNTATNSLGSNGGGAFFVGTANLTQTTFSANSGTLGGGARFNSTANLSATNFISNTTSNDFSAAGAYFQSTANLTNTIFSANTTTNNDSDGGARFNQSANLRGATFSNNLATGNDSVGGARFNGTTHLYSTLFVNNQGQIVGGANFNSTAVVSATTFDSNTGNSSGGAYFVANANVSGAIFSHNRVTGDDGGGGAFFANSVNITNTIFTSNVATSTNSTGGVYLLGSGVNNERFVNVLFAANHNNGAGMALIADHAGGNDTLTLLHTTIASPTLGNGSALLIMSGTAYITNTIVASHTIGIAANNNPVVENHNLFADVTLPYSGTISSGGNSITGTADFYDTTAYTVSKGSLAVDMGVNSGLMNDFFGTSRPQNSASDMGYYESPWALAPAEIDVLGNGLSIVNGDDTPAILDYSDFGSAEMNLGGITRTFTIKNLGAAPLTLAADAITLNGVNANYFTVITQPAISLAVSQSTLFVLHFTPLSVGIYTVTLTIANDDSDESPYTFVIRGTGINSPPMAQADSYTINEDNALSVAAMGVLANDSDINGDALSAVLASNVATGTLQLHADGSLIYTPTLNFNGIVTFTYKARSTLADSSPITVTITVKPVADLMISDRTQAEGNSANSSASFTVSIDQASALPIVVEFVSSDNTALAGSDYSATQGSVTIPAGAISRLITVTIQGDTLVENNETYTLSLSNPVNATLSDAIGVGTISNDDIASLTIGDVLAPEGDSGPTTTTFTVSMSNTSDAAVTFAYATSDNTASAASDYISVSGTLTIPVGSNVVSFTVTINGDSLVERDETFSVTLSNALGISVTIGDALAEGQIVNDERSNLALSDVTMSEGDSGTAAAIFTVNMSHVSSEDVAVAFTSSDNTANAVADYWAASGTLTIPAGSISNSIPITVLGDLLVERNETFTVTLGSTQGISVALADATGIATLLDDDSATLSISDVAVTEGNSGATSAIFSVTMSHASSELVRIAYATGDPHAIGEYSATAGNDYNTVNTFFTIPAGSTSGSIPVSVNGDSLVERNETFSITLNSAIGISVTIDDGAAVATIYDDDSATLAIADVSVSEGDSATTIALFSVSMSNASSEAVTVAYASADNSAAANDDYLAASGSLTIPAGIESGTIEIAINGDGVVEWNETFSVILSNATGISVTLADASAVSTILNDETSRLSIADVSVIEGDSGSIDAIFSVTMSNASSEDVTVDYTTVAGAATMNDDFAAISGRLTIPVGEIGGLITVTVNGDQLVERSELFGVRLSNASGISVTIDDEEGIATILNDDSASITITDVAVNEGGSGTIDTLFAISLSHTSSEDVLVDFATGDNTATSGDYAVTSGTLIIPTGSSNGIITVTVAGDPLVERDEIFTLNLSNARGISVTIADATGIGKIIDDDSATLSIGDVNVSEGNSGAIQAHFLVTMSHASSEVVMVDFTSSDNTANSANDYVAANDTLILPAHSTSGTINLVINGDSWVERDETFSVTLSNARGISITIDAATGVGELIDDDSATLSIADVSVSEGNSGTTNALFSVTMSNPSSEAVMVNYASSDQTAAASDDYNAVNNTLTIPVGNTSASITVTINGNKMVEADETFLVRLSNPIGIRVALADEEALAIIGNDDHTPVASLQSVSTNEESRKVIGLNGSDLDGDALSYSLVTSPTHGVLELVGTLANYQPVADYYGTDYFSFRVNDGFTDSLLAPITITVAPVNDAPSFSAGGDVTINEDSSAYTAVGWASQIQRGADNESNQVLSFILVNDNAALFAAPPAIDPISGKLSFTPAADQSGNARVTVVLQDNGGTSNGGVDQSAAAHFNITVTTDSDADGIPNLSDLDDDDDNVVDGNDAFPLDANEWLDTDGDQVGNNADPDDDNDNVVDGNDAFPLDANESLDTDGNKIGNNADLDDDDDNVVDSNDAFPLDANESVDTDGDQVGNNADPDDDGDKQSDAAEIACGSNPLDGTSRAADIDHDRLPDCLDGDNNNDGVADRLGIQVSQSVNRALAQIGETVTYTVRITNSGNVSLTVVAVDDQLGALSKSTLAGQSATSVTRTYTVQANDWPGKIIKTVVVTGTSVLGKVVTATAEAQVVVTATARIAVSATRLTSDPIHADSPVDWQINLVNYGNLPVTIDEIDATLATTLADGSSLETEPLLPAQPPPARNLNACVAPIHLPVDAIYSCSISRLAQGVPGQTLYFQVVVNGQSAGLLDVRESDSTAIQIAPQEPSNGSRVYLPVVTR